ncbi:Fc.00g033410.m01.CDS01 [Cosmosporella sp. VM-42]
MELLLQHGARTTGSGRRHYVRSVKFAEKMGHYVAAGLLKRHGGWNEEDKTVVEDEDLLDEERQWSDEDDLDDILDGSDGCSNEEDDELEEDESADDEMIEHDIDDKDDVDGTIHEVDEVGEETS